MNDLEYVIVNGDTGKDKTKVGVTTNLYELSGEEEEDEEHLHLRKEVRANFFSMQHKLATTLTSLAVVLNKYGKDDRVEVLKTTLMNTNTWISESRELYDAKTVYSPC